MAQVVLRETIIEKVFEDLRYESLYPGPQSIHQEQQSEVNELPAYRFSLIHEPHTHHLHSILHLHHRASHRISPRKGWSHDKAAHSLQAMLSVLGDPLWWGRLHGFRGKEQA